jgi:hypothetical protein
VTAARRAEAAALIVISLVAALFSSNFLLDVAFAQDTDWTSVVSVLEVSEGHPRALLRTTDILCGVLVIVLVPFVHAALPRGAWQRWVAGALVVYALAGAGAALVPLPCAVREMCATPTDDLQRLAHDGFSVVAQAALFVSVVAAALATRSHGPRWLHLGAWAVFVTGGVVCTLFSGYYALTDPAAWQSGVAQRVQLGIVSVWIVCLGVYAATDGLQARARSTIR